MTLSTERLTLRELSFDDAEFILELLNEEDFIKYIADKGVRNIEDAKNYIKTGPQASYEAHGFGLLRIGLKSDDTPIGICGLLKRDYLDDPDIGYALLKQYRGKGYAFEAASAIMNKGKVELGIRKIVAITSVDNLSSGRLLEKLGLKFEKLAKFGDDKIESKFFS